VVAKGGVVKRGHQLAEVVDAGLAPSVVWLQKKIRSGRITARKLGRHWVMTDEDVDAMLEAFANRTNVRDIRPAGGLSAASQRRRSA
jgi:chromosome condensin MukBEF MukE localization factor